MTRKEYYEEKETFEQFKKELKKEIGSVCKFVMSYAQFCNRTFTAYVGEITPYEKRIAEWSNPCEDFKDIAAKIVDMYEKDLAKYGTPEKEVGERIEKIVNSAAYKKFAELWGIKWETEIKTEYGKEYKYLRFRF